MGKKKLVVLASAIALVLTCGSALAGDPQKGKRVFNKCLSCHPVKKEGKQGIGPNLFGVVGRKAGSVQQYKRYTGLKNADFVWDEATLDAWLANPKKFIKKRGRKKTLMMVKLRKVNQRDDVIAYLSTLK